MSGSSNSSAHEDRLEWNYFLYLSLFHQSGDEKMFACISPGKVIQQECLLKEHLALTPTRERIAVSAEGELKY